MQILREKDRYITLALALEKVGEIRLNLNFLGVINYGISEICFANIVLQKHFLPDPCLIDKGTTFLAQNTSQNNKTCLKVLPLFK